MNSQNELSEILLKMGAERIGSQYIYNCVHFEVGDEYVVCRFTPPRGKIWINKLDYSNILLEEIVRSFFFIGEYLKDVDVLKYSLPVFMQNKYIDGNIALLHNAFLKRERNNKLRILYDSFINDWNYRKYQSLYPLK